MYIWLKWCGTKAFMGVSKCEVISILWMQGFLSSCNQETDHLADNVSYPNIVFNIKFSDIFIKLNLKFL